MATGWARDGAVQDQIDASVEDAVELARSRLPRGESLLQCEECGADIPEGRREALPGVRLCVECQSERDRRDGSRYIRFLSEYAETVNLVPSHATD